jgi:hypothetical protein
MSAFFSLEFTGNAQSIIDTLKEHFPFDIEHKKCSSNKIFIKFAEETSADDISFILTGVTVKVISKTEYNTTAENGFELITNSDIKFDHPKDEVVVNTPKYEAKTEKIEKPQAKKSEDFIKTKEVNVESNKVISDTTSVNQIIESALSDAILPSKSPLAPEDPFNYLSSYNYLKNFVHVSVVVLFLITLFN